VLGIDNARTVVRRALFCLALIAGCDGLSALVDLGSPGLAVLDEPSHLATAFLLVTVGVAMASRADAVPTRSVLGTALVSSVLIDVDHFPETVFSSTVFMGSLDRPYTHSLLTPLAAIALALLTRHRHVSTIFGGIALGTSLHFVRDVCTGPGLGLAWPLSSSMVRLPYVVYWAVLIAALAASLLLLYRDRQRPFGAVGGPVSRGSGSRRVRSDARTWLR
jgi:membrane-bound metal-dependent hydrolase YbcI (DUF457 family)